jgi:hypothetical protein
MENITPASPPMIVAFCAPISGSFLKFWDDCLHRRPLRTEGNRRIFAPRVIEANSYLPEFAVHFLKFALKYVDDVKVYKFARLAGFAWLDAIRIQQLTLNQELQDMFIEGFRVYGYVILRSRADIYRAAFAEVRDFVNVGARFTPMLLAVLQAEFIPAFNEAYP